MAGRRIPITVDADTKGDFGKATKGLDDVARKGDDADKSLRKMSKGAETLDAEIGKVTHSIKAMRGEFEKTGDIDLLKDARKLESTRKRLEQFQKEFATAGEESGKTFSAGLQGALKTPIVGPAIAGAIAAGITLGAPLIGAALAVAVGGGAIAGGIMLAAKDPRVGDAWGELADGAKDKLTGAADVFVDPLLRGADRFDATLHNIMPSISADFAAMVPIVDHLVDGTSGMVEEMMPGIDALVHTAGPTLTMVAGELPRVGAAFSSMFESIAAGGEGGKQALQDMLVLTEGMIVNTGKTIEGFEKLYQADRAFYGALAATFTNNQTAWENAGKQMLALKYGTKATIPVADMAADAFKKVAASMVPAGQEALITGDQFKALSGQINAAAQTSDILAGQMTGKLFTSMMSLDQATLGFAESQSRVSESIKENGTQLDIHTEKGQANREVVLAAVTANMAQYQANLAAGMAAGDAALAYDTNTTALEDQLRAAHFTQGEIDGLIAKYRGVPNKVNTDIATNGLTSAIENLDALIRRINGIPTRKDIYITEHVNNVIRGGQSPDRLFDYPGAYAAGGRVGHMATGGRGVGRYMVGENGPEEVDLPDGAYVRPNHRMSGRGAAGNFEDEIIGVVRIEVSGPSGEQVQNALLRLASQRGRTVAQVLNIKV